MMKMPALRMTILWSLAATLASAFDGVARAADLRDVLTDYTITSWSARDGLPSGTIWSLAQDVDGFLWVGTDGGLHRFDGVRFLSMHDLGIGASATASVRVLHAARDGSLFVGFGDQGGITRVSGKDVRRYADSDGLPRAPITAIVEDVDGTVLAGTEEGLYVLEHDRWQAPGRAAGLPAGGIYSAFIDREGNAFVGTQHGILRRAAGSGHFDYVERAHEQPPNSAVESTRTRFPRSFSHGPFEQIVVTDSSVGFRHVGEHPTTLAHSKQGRGFRLLLDGRGGLWVGTIGQGLWRVRHNAAMDLAAMDLRVERATSQTGLPSDGIFALIEDRDGNIWAGTTEGLTRLTPRRITQLTDYGIVVAIDAAPDDNIWVGTTDELIRFSPENLETPTARWALGNTRLRTMYVDPHGTVWASTDQGVSRIMRGRGRLIPVPGTASLDQVVLMTSDSRGGVWMHDYKRGVVRWSDTGIEASRPGAFPGPAFSMFHTDGAGRVWTAPENGGIAIMWPDGDVQAFGPGDGVSAGVYRQLWEDASGTVWLAGTEGLTRYHDGIFKSIRPDTGFPASDLTAVVGDDSGNLWIGTSTGIIRVAKTEIVTALATPSHTIQYSRYDRADGLGGMPIAYNTNKRVIRAKDGRLWFVTSRGLTLIDPRALGDVRLSPPVTFDYAMADDERVEAAPNARVRAGTSRLEIAYTELNLTSPSRARFRYRLEGFDENWIDAGTRRQVFYTNLPPRRYRLHVETVRADGRPSHSAAIWDFSIAPMFYETKWFYAGATALAGLAVWGAWRLRLRQVRRQFSLVLGERVRLSRDLHDTLLQGLVGMALQFDAIGTDLAASSPGVQPPIIRLRKQVEEFIREARQSILDLRSPKVEQQDLVTALRDGAQQAVGDNPLAFDFVVIGSPRPCGRKVQEQLLRIGQEAVINAVRHARASLIRMNLAFDTAAVSLQVSDDGQGFDPETIRRENHYGLVSMRERAEAVGGTLEVTSGVQAGTTIAVVVPISAGD